MQPFWVKYAIQVLGCPRVFHISFKLLNSSYHSMWVTFYSQFSSVAWAYHQYFIEICSIFVSPELFAHGTLNITGWWEGWFMHYQVMHCSYQIYRFHYALYCTSYPLALLQHYQFMDFYMMDSKVTSSNLQSNRFYIASLPSSDWT